MWRHTSIPKWQSYFHPVMQARASSCVNASNTNVTIVKKKSSQVPTVCMNPTSNFQNTGFFIPRLSTVQVVQNSLNALLLYPLLRCTWRQWGKAAQNPEIAGIKSKWCNCQSLSVFWDLVGRSIQIQQQSCPESWPMPSPRDPERLCVKFYWQLALSS
jgi:hypothetical protein